MITQFEHYKESNNVYDNLKILRNYIDIVNNYTEDEEFFTIQSVTIIYNFLILEIGFREYIPIKNAINGKLLYIDKEAKTFEDVFEIFDRMYSPDGVIRNCVEKFDTIDIVKNYLKDKPYIYKNLIDIEKTLENIELFISTRKYNL